MPMLHERWEIGSILLIALVLLAIILIFLSAISGLIITQRHAMAENIRTTHAFHLADSGFDYFVSLIVGGTCTPQRLANQTITRALIDPETNRAIGTYSLNFSASGKNLTASSVGQTQAPGQCHAVVASLVEQNQRYEIFWRSQGAVPCPAPPPLTEPVCT